MQSGIYFPMFVQNKIIFGIQGKVMSMDMRIVQTIIVVSLWISIVGIVLIYGLHFRSELMIYVISLPNLMLCAGNDDNQNPY